MRAIGDGGGLSYKSCGILRSKADYGACMNMWCPFHLPAGWIEPWWGKKEWKWYSIHNKTGSNLTHCYMAPPLGEFFLRQCAGENSWFRRIINRDQWCCSQHSSLRLAWLADRKGWPRISLDTTLKWGQGLWHIMAVFVTLDFDKKTSFDGRTFQRFQVQLQARAQLPCYLITENQPQSSTYSHYRRILLIFCF